MLREIDTKVDGLGCTIIKKNQRRDSCIPSDDFADKGVCELLEKIDKFGESEKIYDKNMLRA